MKNKKWTSEKIKTVKSLAGKGYPDNKIAEMMEEIYHEPFTFCMIEKIRRRTGTKSLNITAKKEVTTTSNYSTIISAIKEQLRNATPYDKIIKTEIKSDTLMIQFTDWHIGKRIKDEYGVIIFNENIARQRVDELITQELSLLDNHISKGVPIKDAIIMFNGDIVDGMGIFASQESQSEMAPPFQVMLAAEIIQKLVLALLKRKIRIRMYGVKGNHGEIRENGKSKDPNANWDLMLYLILELWIKTMLKNPMVSINYSELDYINFEVNGWKYHMRHIAPVQSETSAGKAKFLGWVRKHKFDAAVFGHFHHWGAWDRSRVFIFRGGSLTGEDDFSEKLAEESSPTQLMWGCSKKRPMTFFYAVDLGGKK